MAETLTLVRQTAAFDRVLAERSVLLELEGHLAFRSPGADFDPRVRAGYWDGLVRLFSARDGLSLAGHRAAIEKFCRDRDYAYAGPTDESTLVSEADVLEFAASLNAPFVPRSYQIEAVQRALEYPRSVILSPTASGKSFIIYLLCRWFDLPTLVIVPRVSLVEQMRSDFHKYGYDEVHGIYAGKDKHVAAPVVFSTWQSLKDMGEDYFSRFRVVVGDEVHRFKAKELRGIMERCSRAEVRIGLTGTLDGTTVHQTLLEGLFGPVHRVANTRDLIDAGYLSDLSIKCLVLQYPEREKRELARLKGIAKKQKKSKYAVETQFLVDHDARCSFLAKLAIDGVANTLLLFRRLDHGRALYERVREMTDRPVFYVAGSTPVTDREAVRQFIDSCPASDAIAIASEGVFSEGTDIPNLSRVIFATPSKGRVKTLQSIGRGLRKTESKTDCKLYDVADDLTLGSTPNFALSHYAARLKIYDEERFDYKVYNLEV